MNTNNKRFRFDQYLTDREASRIFDEDVHEGLSSAQKFLKPKYFYDDYGSDLFENITELPEYYLTRAETSIINTISSDLMRTLDPTEIVELGSGSSVKTQSFLNNWDYEASLRTFIPFDVSRSIVENSSKSFLASYPKLNIHGIIGDFERHLEKIPKPSGKRLILFLGSTLGNLDPEFQVKFLTNIHDLLHPLDRLLIGIDLVKNETLLNAAYNDSAGITAKFNKNILSVLNNRVGSNFDEHNFEHYAYYNQNTTRIEMHLVSKTTHDVFLPKINLHATFRSEETIWTESSYKFTKETIEDVLVQSGLRIAQWHTDKLSSFALVLVGLR